MSNLNISYKNAGSWAEPFGHEFNQQTYTWTARNNILKYGILSKDNEVNLICRQT